MAITGYEVDQVRQLEGGEEVSVPITWAYNHHYSAKVLNSKKAKLVKQKPNDHETIPLTSRDEYSIHHGAEEYWTPQVLVDDVDEDPIIPQVHWFAEGYPKGYAQIIELPDTFQITPMQIDTWNRNMNNATFLPGPLSKSSQISTEKSATVGFWNVPVVIDWGKNGE